ELVGTAGLQLELQLRDPHLAVVLGADFADVERDLDVAVTKPHRPGGAAEIGHERGCQRLRSGGCTDHPAHPVIGDARYIRSVALDLGFDFRAPLPSAAAVVGQLDALNPTPVGAADPQSQTLPG